MVWVLLAASALGVVVFVERRLTYHRVQINTTALLGACHRSRLLLLLHRYHHLHSSLEENAEYSEDEWPTTRRRHPPKL